MGNKITCPQCGSSNTHFYDGLLGYEAVRCDDCNQETDLNNEHSHCERHDRSRPAIASMDFTPHQTNQVIALLWDSLKRDPEHKDRRQTGWGTKTKAGLAACIERIATEPEPRKPEAKS